MLATEVKCHSGSGIFGSDSNAYSQSFCLSTGVNSDFLI